jgi:hypothetical protein
MPAQRFDWRAKQARHQQKPQRLCTGVGTFAYAKAL